MVTPTLFEYAKVQLRRVSNECGIRISVRHDDEVRFGGEVRIQPEHAVIAFDARGERHLTHIALLGAEKVRRLYSVPPHARLLPWYSLKGRLPPADEQHFLDVLREQYRPYYADFSRQTRTRFLQQLIRHSWDIRAEATLFDEVPVNRPAQASYQAWLLSELRSCMAPSVAAGTPPRIYKALESIQCAYALACVQMTETPLAPEVRASSHRAEGRRLLQQLRDIEEQDYEGDRKAIEGVARELGFASEFDWRQIADREEPIGY